MNIDDPIIEALRRIESKVDNVQETASDVTRELEAIRRECAKTATTRGAAAGAAAGGIVSTAISLLAAKLSGYF